MNEKHIIQPSKIARALGAEHRGKVTSSGGYFGAMQLVAEIQLRFRVPTGGGRATDPGWIERRQVPLTKSTLRRLDQIAEQIRDRSGVQVSPLQIAALLLEQATAQVDDKALAEMATGQTSKSD